VHGCQLHTATPQQDRLLARRARCHARRGGPATHLVAGEAEGAQLRLEVPNHHAAVERARDELLQVGVERDRRDGVPVPAEAALQRGVVGLRRGQTGRKKEHSHGWCLGVLRTAARPRAAQSLRRTRETRRAGHAPAPTAAAAAAAADAGPLLLRGPRLPPCCAAVTDVRVCWGNHWPSALRPWVQVLAAAPGAPLVAATQTSCGASCGAQVVVERCFAPIETLEVSVSCVASTCRYQPCQNTTVGLWRARSN
jgi:hypothetical protein